MSDVIRNPFRTSVVSDPWESPETNVPILHQKAFELCCRAIHAVRSGVHSTGILIHGEAGSGKTHLLARLRAHNAHEAEADGPGGLQAAIFVSVRLHTSPNMLWRHIRSCLVKDLLRTGPGGWTQLDRILLHLLKNKGLIEDEGQAWLAGKRLQARQDLFSNWELDDLFIELDARTDISFNTRTVLAHLFFGRNRGSASSWLMGQNLSDAVLQKLGVTTDYDEYEEQEEHARRTVISLSSLATADLPLIFCFDQVEALVIDSNDVLPLKAFGKMISSLQATTSHTLLISSIQTSFEPTLDNALKADYARIREFGLIALNHLTWDEARQLAIERMDAVPALQKCRSEKADPLWPLTEEKLRAYLSSPYLPPDRTDKTPRQLIAHCAELFEEHSEVSRKPTIEGYLSSQLEKRRVASDERIVEEVLAHGLPSLLKIVGSNWQKSHKAGPDALLLLESGQMQKALISCDNKPGPSLVKKFDKVDQIARNNPAIELVLVRDPQQPISATAKVSREKRKQLIEKGVKWIEPNQEGIATLDALRLLLSDATSGDLNLEGETIWPATVNKWIESTLPSELKDLVADLLPVDSSPDLGGGDRQFLREEISELLQNHFVISIADIAARLGRSEAEIIESANQYGDRLGVLGDPPAVMFHLMAGESVLQK